MPPARGPRTEAGRAAQRARLRRAALVVLVVAGIALLGTLGVVLASELADTPKGAYPAEAAGGATSSTNAERDPTSLFASCSGLDLRLPVDPASITALAFHQASYGTNALHMTSLVPDADMALAEDRKEVQPASNAADLPDTVWAGTCLRLWRTNGTGLPDTAVDVGADPGTPVYAPVTGTVLKVKPYKLYDQFDDFQIHIQPDGRTDVVAVLIHVDDVSVAAGERVKAGVTRIAAVRKLSHKISDMQITGYTTNGGDHTHLQLNRVAAPDATGDATGS